MAEFREDRADPVELRARAGDQLLRLGAQVREVRRARVVQVVGGELELGLQPHVAVAHQRPRLELDRVGDAVEDHVEHGPGPLELAPPARLLERVLPRVRARAERQHQPQVVRLPGPHDVRVGAHRRVDRVDAAVDQRVGARAGAVGRLGGLEVARRGRGGARRGREREVVLRVVARAGGAEEEREPVVDVVRGGHHVDEGVGQPGVAEVAIERGVEARRPRSARRASRRRRRPS